MKSHGKHSWGPVCGMDIATAAGTSEYNGRTYYFCSLGCKKAFDKEPENILAKLMSKSINITTNFLLK